MYRHLYETIHIGNKIIILIFFFIFGVNLQILNAETIIAIENISTQKQLAHVPKNGEEFLSRLKILLRDKNNTGLNFAEKLTGVELEKWKTDKNPYDSNYYYRYYNYNYRSTLIVDDYRNNIYFFLKIGLNKLNTVKYISSITPETTRLFLEKPSKILSYIDDKTENSNQSQLIYRYNINNFIVRFQYEINNDTPLEILYDSNLIEDFKYHRNFMASKIIISHPNPLKLQHSGIGSKFVEKISMKIPKNGTELLQRINSTLKNYNKSISFIAEEIAGVNIDQWEETKNEEGKYYSLYIPLYDLEDYSEFPYSFYLNLYREKSSFKVNFRQVKNYSAKFKMSPIVCVTSEKTKEILGEPSKIISTDQCTTEGVLNQIKYFYENDDIVIEFIYPNPQVDSNKCIDFIQHKKFCARSIEYKKK